MHSLASSSPFALLSRLAVAALALGPVAACATTPAPQIQTYTSDAAGFDTSTYWLDTGREVVVFDAQFTPALAEAMLAAIRAETASPVSWVVVTHPNPDKFNGVGVFQRAGAKVVASAKTAAAIPAVHAYKRAYFVGAGMFTEATYPPEPSIDVTFEGRMTLPGTGVELVELAHGGVTSNQTVALVEGGAIAGDLFANRAHAWLEGGVASGRAAPDLAAWHAALDETLALAGADRVVYPGRGVPLPAAVAVAEQHAYLAEAERVVAARLATLADPAETLAGPEGGAHFAAIQGALAAAFPEHRFPYLVGYGVYGLAFQLASR